MRYRKINTYPMLNSDLLRKTQWKSIGYTFLAKDPVGDRILDLKESETDSGDLFLEDPQGIWSPESNDLEVRFQFQVQNPSVLFGENGIADENARIGIGLQWYSKESRQRGSLSLLTLKRTDRFKEGTGILRFHEGELRGDLHLRPILYIASRVKAPRFNYFANEEGMLIGIFEQDEINIRLDGTGSMFPVISDSLDSPLLWKLRCSWNEPEYDLFEETVQIILNSSHPDFPLVNISSKKFKPQMLREIVASALKQIILKYKEDEEAWQKTMEGEDLYEGSVSEAIFYFINALHWDASSVISLSASIREYLEGEFAPNEAKKHKPR